MHIFSWADFLFILITSRRYCNDFYDLPSITQLFCIHLLLTYARVESYTRYSFEVIIFFSILPRQLLKSEWVAWNDWITDTKRAPRPILFNFENSAHNLPGHMTTGLMNIHFTLFELVQFPPDESLKAEKSMHRFELKCLKFFWIL